MNQYFSFSFEVFFFPISQNTYIIKFYLNIFFISKYLYEREILGYLNPFTHAKSFIFIQQTLLKILYIIF